MTKNTEKTIDQENHDQSKDQKTAITSTKITVNKLTASKIQRSPIYKKYFSKGITHITLFDFIVNELLDEKGRLFVPYDPNSTNIQQLGNFVVNVFGEDKNVNISSDDLLPWIVTFSKLLQDNFSILKNEYFYVVQNNADGKEKVIESATKKELNEILKTITNTSKEDIIKRCSNRIKQFKDMIELLKVDPRGFEEKTSFAIFDQEGNEINNISNISENLSVMIESYTSYVVALKNKVLLDTPIKFLNEIKRIKKEKEASFTSNEYEDLLVPINTLTSPSGKISNSITRIGKNKFLEKGLYEEEPLKKHGKIKTDGYGKPLITQLSFSFLEDNINNQQVKLSKPLSQFTALVQKYLMTHWNASNRIISILELAKEIYMLPYKSKVTKDQLESVTNSIRKLMTTLATIKGKFRGDNIDVERTLIHGTIITVKDKKTKEPISVLKMDDAPILLSLEQLTTKFFQNVSIDTVLNVPKVNTKNGLSIKNYLLDKITSMKSVQNSNHSKKIVSNVILVDPIYEELNISSTSREDRKKRSTTIKNIETCLNFWEKNGFIGSFEAMNEKRSRKIRGYKIELLPIIKQVKKA